MSVAAIDCGRRSATGEYCRVTIHAVNVSDSFPVFDEVDQVAYDTAGRAFRPDPAATAAVNDGRAVKERLQPGQVMSAVLVFDLPAADRIDHLVLHGKSGTTGEIFPAP